MKFATSARPVLIALMATALIHFLLMVSQTSMARGRLPTALSLGGVLVSCGLLVWVEVFRRRMKGRKTLDIGRRGFSVTKPNAAPFALSWQMIKTANLEPGTPAQWRFHLKNGETALLREANFSREQRKKICTQLDRKLKARKIPIRVASLGPEGGGAG